MDAITVYTQTFTFEGNALFTNALGRELRVYANELISTYDGHIDVLDFEANVTAIERRWFTTRATTTVKVRSSRASLLDAIARDLLAVVA